KPAESRATCKKVVKRRTAPLGRPVPPCAASKTAKLSTQLNRRQVPMRQTWNQWGRGGACLRGVASPSFRLTVCVSPLVAELLNLGHLHRNPHLLSKSVNPFRFAVCGSDHCVVGNESLASLNAETIRVILLLSHQQF